MEEIKSVFIAVVVLAIIASPVIFIFIAATRRSNRQQKVWQAADKYLKTD
jgi:hypothetical protein